MQLESCSASKLPRDGLFLQFSQILTALLRAMNFYDVHVLLYFNGWATNKFTQMAQLQVELRDIQSTNLLLI